MTGRDTPGRIVLEVPRARFRLPTAPAPRRARCFLMRFGASCPERETPGVAMTSATSSAHGITRKEFLAGAAAATAALPLSPRLTRGQDKPIKIGGQFCLTGGLAPFGTWGHRAAEAAITKINAE